MTTAVESREGTIPFHGYKTWYRVVGAPEEPGRLPLLCLHGGPGATHYYLEPLEGLAGTGRRVIFYDQLGCGNSDHLPDASLYTVALYLEELEAVRRALGLDRIHLLGHSWGGMLALEYALTQPPGLAGLILANTAASIPQWVSEMELLVAELPPEVQETLSRHQAAGTTDSPEYLEAAQHFLRRHLDGRLDPRPDCLKRMAEKWGDVVYEAMWGPQEWFVTGSLKGWDVSDRLGEIGVPTLVVGGRFDHATPLLAERLHRGIRGSESVIFEKSGHLPHLEETELYMEVLSQFLDRVEAAS